MYHGTTIVYLEPCTYEDRKHLFLKEIKQDIKIQKNST